MSVEPVLRGRSARLLALLATALSAQRAPAASKGGVFSGPTRASGSSAYWDPAALAPLDEDWGTYLELSGNLAGAQYERAGIDPYTRMSYPPVSFFGAAPDLSFTLATPPLCSWLRPIAGGFLATGSAVLWPKEGPQRFLASSGHVVRYALTAGLLAAPQPWWGIAVTAGPAYARLGLERSFDFGAYANAKLPPGADLFANEDPSMEGELRLRATGWSAVVVLGGWMEATPWWRIGVGVHWQQMVPLAGEILLTSPPALDKVAPGIELQPKGKITLDYPVPWRLHMEQEFLLNPVTVAVLLEFAHQTAQPVIVAHIKEAEPDFIEGHHHVIKNDINDWAVGARISYRFLETLEGAIRLDVDPRCVPSETITPTNLDFTSIQTAAGVRWQFSAELAFALSYTFAYVMPINVTNSIYNPRAPSDSGLAMPSANGTYKAWLHRIVLGFHGVWGGGP